MLRQHKFLIIVLVGIAFLAVLIFYSPRFLRYSTDHKKSDAIIILLGPDFKARKKEANELINEGMANYLIIPAYHKTYAVNKNEKGQYLSPVPYLPGNKENTSLVYPGYYEDTHIELIEAKKVMTDYGLKSAIFVSSPYHMRRIKLIAAKIFDFGKNDFYFVPTLYEKAPANILELSLSDWKKVRREYGKMIWFLIYFNYSEYINTK